MNLRKLIFVNNENYKTKKTNSLKGVMVHSTGANNPELRRYVGPDDGKLGKNQYNNHWNMAMDRQVCVHAFIGKLADGSIATYQTLPWSHRAWHGASGSKGSVNDTHIGFEICEDGLTNAAYFGKVYQEAIELVAYLCLENSWDPMGDGVIIGHYEGYKRGIASNHGDPDYWLKRHGKSMDTFRADVKALLKSKTESCVTSSSVNLREAPGTQYDIVRKLPAGEKVSLVVRLGSWAYVSHINGNGYLYTSYLSQAKPESTDSDPINGPWMDANYRLWFRSVAGSYRTREAAEASVKGLREAGYAYAWLEAIKLDGAQWFRAHAGSHDRRGPAEKEVESLKTIGYKDAWLQAIKLEVK